MEAIVGILSLVMIIVFFVMSTNIGTMVTLQRQILREAMETNDLIKLGLPEEKLQAFNERRAQKKK